ncbi:MAG TPA: HisA/HisF-related TIM barrel protein [Gemmatimonadales bacterium]|jgi:phosphoribosylformimino-5-aminoimidazole carboxamide ribotide isomerase
MQLIPVIDLAHGAAVQARAGDRARYRPVESVLTPGRRGDPLALVQAYREQVGARECYVADLDAIQGGEPQRSLLRELVRAAAPCTLLVDAGTGAAAAVAEVLAIGAAAAVVGLETLRRFEDLSRIVAVSAPERVIFSLDLRQGRPVRPAGITTESDPVELAARAVAAGIATLLVLDVGRVGTGGGVDLDLLRRVRRRCPRVRLLAGGGVAGADDLARLADAGCNGALVATALHTGRIGQSSASASRQVADCP